LSLINNLFDQYLLLIQSQRLHVQEEYFKWVLKSKRPIHITGLLTNIKPQPMKLYSLMIS